MRSTRWRPAVPEVIRVRLRPVREADLAALEEGHSRDADPWNWFRHMPAGGLRRHFAEGMISEEGGTLAVETPEGALAGGVSWFTVPHGPTAACRALNIGISLLPGQRGRGYGAAVTAAVSQAALGAGAAYLVLFTDLANPTSNALYQRLGYEPIEDRVVLAFEAPG